MPMMFAPPPPFPPSIPPAQAAPYLYKYAQNPPQSERSGNVELKIFQFLTTNDVLIQTIKTKNLNHIINYGIRLLDSMLGINIIEEISYQ